MISFSYGLAGAKAYSPSFPILFCKSKFSFPLCCFLSPSLSRGVRGGSTRCLGYLRIMRKSQKERQFKHGNVNSAYYFLFFILLKCARHVFSKINKIRHEV